MVAQPLRRAGKLGILSGLCVAPLQLGGLRGKQSTPSVWLGGTVVVSMVGKWERHGTTMWDSIFKLFTASPRYACALFKKKRKMFELYMNS